MKRAIATALTATAIAVTPTEAPADCNSRTCDIRVARKRCDRGEFRQCILRAALHRSQPYGDMVRVAWCESRFNRLAVNGVHLGPFQFRLDTWNTTPYRRYSRSSWKWSSLATAWMWASGRRSEWACR